MFKNYFKTALRNLKKNKIFSAINIVGLAVGMSACIIILLFVTYERQFDSIHKKNIYRLDEVQNFEGMVAPQNVALSMFPMGPTLQAEFPEVKKFTRVRNNERVDMRYEEKKLELPNVYWVDSTFLQMFDFKLVQGDHNTALMKPNSLLITEETAAKMFGNQNPMGKTVSRYGGDTVIFTVTGVLANIPANSHLQFDALASFNTIIKPDFMENWGGNWLTTYLELAPNANVASMEKRFPAYLKEHMTENDGWKSYTLFLQSLKDVHAGSTNITHDYLNFRKFDKTYTYLFSIIGLVILLIACINFMNLSTARSAERAKEVGIRKTIGAGRSQLAIQFMAESVILSVIAFVIAILLAKLFIPYVNKLSQRELNLSFTDFPLLLKLIAAAIVVGLISGIYPAGYLSSFQPIRVLKGIVQSGKNKSLFRNALVIGQFTGAIFLIIATIFAIRQLKFMQHKDPGFNRDQVLVISMDNKSNEKYSALKKEFSKSALISGVTASGQRLGNNLHQTGVVFHGEGPARSLASSQVVVDPDYLKVYQIPIIFGRNFSQDYGADNSKAYVINETLAKELMKDQPAGKMENLVGKKFGFGGMDSAGFIAGICKDFNFNSLHHKIETLCILDQVDWGFAEISVKINGSKAKEAVAHLKAVWKDILPNTNFEYSFLDDHFEELYRADSQVSEVVGILATLAIIISCLGLFGLASYSAERRIKEIGIRKVLGASVSNIVMQLSGNFIRLVLISIVIAIPLAWWAISVWLRDFAYRVSIGWAVFLVAGLLAVVIALVTVSFQAIRAAIANPVKSLRTE